jgi:D-alanyl-D-alanine carboxypeptidase
VVLLATAVAGCSSGSPTTAATTTTTATPVVQQVVDEAQVALGAPGVLATVLQDGETAAVASGASDPSGTPLAPDATVPIGSVTKVLTAALVLDAVDRGELTLDTTVDDVLPGLLRDGATVTVRMLLEHTSGLFAVGDEGDLAADIGRLTDPALRAEAQQLAAAFARGEPVVPSVPLLVALAETHDRYGPPGTTFHYSNVNYLLLGQALETVAGAPLAALLQQRVVEPLGLAHTALAAPGDPVDVRGFVLGADGALSDPGNAHLLLRGNGASGSATSTTSELLTALRAIVAGDLLPAELTTAMRTPTLASHGAYGLGLATYHLRCGTFYGHAGGIAGVDVSGLVSPDAQDGVVLAANARPADGREQLLPIAEQLLCTELALG